MRERHTTFSVLPLTRCFSACDMFFLRNKRCCDPILHQSCIAAAACTHCLVSIPKLQPSGWHRWLLSRLKSVLDRSMSTPSFVSALTPAPAGKFNGHAQHVTWCVMLCLWFWMVPRSSGINPFVKARGGDMPARMAFHWLDTNARVSVDVAALCGYAVTVKSTCVRAS